jgi:predicted Zn-dependent peptidase
MSSRVAKAKAERAEPRAISHTLKNGLSAIAVPLDGVHRVVIAAYLRVGPRYESSANNGVSHFLEHMLYRGTRRHPSAHAQALAFERLGGTLVAITGVESGTMAIGVPPESFAPVLDLFAEVYRQPVFSGIEIEKGIVREEILESMDDDGREVDADQLMRRLVFGAHPLGFPITGSIERLEGFERAGLARHHRRHYVAKNTVITVTGAIDPERALADVERRFEALPEGKPPRAETPPAAGGPRFSYVKHVASSQTSIRLGFRAPGEHDPLEPATDVLLRLLDDGMSTRLYHRICDTRGLCYDVSAGYESYRDVGLFDIAADAGHERALDVLTELLGVVRELRDAGPSDDELDKAKTRHRWQLQALLDDPGEIADFFGVGTLSGTSKSLAERRARIDSVTKTDVLRAAERVFCRDGLAAVAVGVLPKRAQNDLARQIALFS